MTPPDTTTGPDSSARRIEPAIVRYGEHPSQFVEIWGDGPDRTAILIHGGYWRAKFACDLMHPMARTLLAEGWRVVNLEYRRIGQVEDPWPAMAADIEAGLGLVPGLTPSVIVGHSAGGHLALWAASRPGCPPLAGIVALAPLADLASADEQELSNHACAELFGPDPQERAELYTLTSPIRLVPLKVPQLVIHGKADVDVPERQSSVYVAAAKTAGDEVEFHQPDGVDHFHIIDPTTEVWRYAQDQMGRWAPTSKTS